MTHGRRHVCFLMGAESGGQARESRADGERWLMIGAEPDTRGGRGEGWESTGTRLLLQAPVAS